MEEQKMNKAAIKKMKKELMKDKAFDSKFDCLFKILLMSNDYSFQSTTDVDNLRIVYLIYKNGADVTRDGKYIVNDHKVKEVFCCINAPGDYCFRYDGQEYKKHDDILTALGIEQS